MKGSRKSRKSSAQDFPESTIDRVIKILGVNPSKKYRTPSGSLTTVKEETRNRLSLIVRYCNPDQFNDWVPPAKIRQTIKKQHGKISDALDVMRALSGPEIDNPESSKEYALIKKRLCEVSDVSPEISHELIGHDVVMFDSNLLMALDSLEKVERYFWILLSHAEASVKGRGETKPKNTYADHILGSLCTLYKDITGQAPVVSLHKDTGTARGKIIEFLDYILRELSYPHEMTHWALEKKLRKLKSHKEYAKIWKDCKR